MKSRSVTPKADKELQRWCDELSGSTIPPDDVPAGWFTVAQLANKLDRSHCNTSERVRKMVSAGKAEKKTFRIQLEERVRPVPHYRLK